MPRHIKATDIPMAVRKPHLDRYTRQLRDALHSPVLSDEQRADIKDKLAHVGEMKPYAKLAARSAARLAAARGEEIPTPTPEPVAEEPATPVDESPVKEGATLDDLLGLTKAGLIDLATERKVSFMRSWNKTQIAEAILEDRGDG